MTSPRILWAERLGHKWMAVEIIESRELSDDISDCEGRLPDSFAAVPVGPKLRARIRDQSVHNFKSGRLLTR